jgi:fucokinase
MAQVLETADRSEIIALREMNAALLQTEDAIRCIRAGEDRPADALIGHYTTVHAYPAARHRLFAAFAYDDDQQSALHDARATWTVAQLWRRPNRPPQEHDDEPEAEDYMRMAFERVAESSEPAPPGPGRGGPRPRLARLRPGTEVVATSPARLDLAGGWTDTPPYCFERGGHVVNVGIDLDGRPPVTATVTTLAEPVLVLESHDLGKKIELRDGGAGARIDVGDPFALHKVALRTAGLLSDDVPLRKQLKALGAGLHVTTEARVPKGSGLGTSSILAATLLAALHAAAGRKASARQLIEQTLVLEQRLGTGGGWQDQVGGVAPGIKSTVSRPGIPQKPNVEVLKLSDARLAALEERLVVYYSGQQRLARDILRQVMGRWLGREPAVVGLMNDLKQSAAALRAALLRGDWSRAADQINRYWQIKKELYPGSSTPATDRLFLETRGDYLAASLAGAGGGGFAYFLCKDARQASRLRARLGEHSAQPGSMGSVYATRINREGLRVRRRRLDPRAD